MKEQILNNIEQITGLKCSLKVNAVNTSLRGYITIRPRKAGNKYPLFNFDQMRTLKEQSPGKEPNPNFYSTDSISIYLGNEIYNNEPREKSEPCERKLKAPKVEKPQRGWGSKNSQLRLDKACARYAKRLRLYSNCARYY